MTIEILCSGCDDCNIIVGKVCQALADLNLDAEVKTVNSPHGMDKYFLTGHPGIIVDGRPFATSDRLTVRELKYLLTKRAGH
jgi:hypothetical protein